VGGLGLVHSLYRAHRAVVPAIARLLFHFFMFLFYVFTLCTILILINRGLKVNHRVPSTVLPIHFF